MWLSLFLVFLFNLSITPMSYFLIDWQTRCSNATCLRDFNLGLNDVNYPLRFYLYLSIASAIGCLILSVLGRFLRRSFDLGLPVTIITIGIFDIALFAIGYTGNRPWWIVLFLVSRGFCLSSSRYIEAELLGLIFSWDKGNVSRDRERAWSLSGDSGEYYFSQCIDLFVFIGQVVGMLLIYLVVENSDYAMLFKILSILVLLTGILVVTLYIRVRLLMSAAGDPYKRSNTRLYQSKPLMIFRKPAKSA
jgi:hypothetical protein